jgi:hypothetical protein
MDVFVFILSVVHCVGRGLAAGLFCFLGVLWTVYRIKKLKSFQGTMGCRATDDDDDDDDDDYYYLQY